MHGGIGTSLNKIEDIEKISRPLKIKLGAINDTVQQMAMDILWSDPSANDETLGMSWNQTRDPAKQNNIMHYGPDIVEKFINTNQVSMIIRGHQNCADAIDHFAARQLVTITSCANYAGQNNDACFLLIQKRLVVSPKIIKPLGSGTPWQQIPVSDIPEAANSSVRRALTPQRERRDQI